MKLSLAAVGCLAAAVATGCDRWTAQDANGTLAAVQVEQAALALCPDPGDGGGACPADLVRGLERAAYCDNASMRVRHGAAVPPGGPKCQ